MLNIREMQIKTIRYHLIPVKMAIIKKPEITSLGEDVKKKEHLCTVDRNANWCRHYREQYGLLKKLEMELSCDQ